VVTLLLQPTTAQHSWVDGIDLCEYHDIDFDEVRRRDVAVAVVRAGRGTRQDGRWVENVRAADSAGLTTASYWHLYPSHTSPHHQAELWATAIRGASSSFIAGHWADIACTDGFDPFDLGRYVAAFLRRADELVGHTVGVFTQDTFWRRQVHFGIGDRPRWLAECESEAACTGFAFRTRPSDRGGPGWHRVHSDVFDPSGSQSTTREHGLHLVARGPNESVRSWQQRWLRTPDVALLQQLLNAAGADLAVDGVYGPATDAAVRTWGLLRRRDNGPGLDRETDRTASL
jgi:Glycosyl hydrolases family 25/Putative peptidoglycan binding domain